MAQTIAPPRYSEAEFQTNEISPSVINAETVSSSSQRKEEVKEALSEKLGKVTIKDFK